MGTAPSGWNTPKQNWTPEDVPSTLDFSRIEGNINAIEAGTRTIDPGQAPSSNSGTLRQILDWITNRIKAITGKPNWYDAPDTTLAAAKSHMDATSAHSATSSATANRIMIRDASGRAKVAAPSAADDIAQKATVDAHANITSSPHGATSANTASRIVTRDANGNFSAGTITASLNGNAESVDNIHFRVNNGTFEYDDGTGWKPVGGPMSLICGQVVPAGVAYETAVDIAGAGFIEGINFYSNESGKVKITTDGVQRCERSVNNDNLILCQDASYADGFPLGSNYETRVTGPVRVPFRSSVKIEINKGSGSGATKLNYVISKF